MALGEKNNAQSLADKKNSPSHRRLDENHISYFLQIMILKSPEVSDGLSNYSEGGKRGVHATTTD